MHFGELTDIIRKDGRLRLLLLTSLLVQVIVCLTAVGIYHPDQYFQIIEFSSYQLHKPSAAGHVWEFSAHLRSTMQVYLFSAYYSVCTVLGIRDPYLQLTLLRLLFGLALFILFNVICLYYFRREQRKILYYVLAILNLSWILPYTRTLYSSEMLSSFLFFGALFLYDVTDRRGGRGWLAAVLTGFVFSLAFYARFQTAFAVAGFLVWMLLSREERPRVWPFFGGFLAGILLNTALDAGFYHQLVFTPYTYFKVNILEGKAASMGTASALLYAGVLVAVVLAPPLSIVLMYAGFKRAFLQRPVHPLALSVAFFLLGHCLIAHKEERFLFPVLNVLPVIIGWGLPGLLDWWRRQRKGMRLLFGGMAYFSIGLNAVLLVLLMRTPYSQALYFTSLVKGHFGERPVTIYSLDHTPFETESKLPFVFYQRGAPNLRWRRVSVNDSLRFVRAEAEYVTATYNQVKGQERLLDSLGYERVLYSSRLLWGINEFLDARKVNTINDIWVLYRRR